MSVGAWNILARLTSQHFAHFCVASGAGSGGGGDRPPLTARLIFFTGLLFAPLSASPPSSSVLSPPVLARFCLVGISADRVLPLRSLVQLAIMSLQRITGVEPSKSRGNGKNYDKTSLRLYSHAPLERLGITLQLFPRAWHFSSRHEILVHLAVSVNDVATVFGDERNGLDSAKVIVVALVDPGERSRQMFLQLREQESDFVQPVLGLVLAVADIFYLALAAEKLKRSLGMFGKKEKISICKSADTHSIST